MVVGGCGVYIGEIGKDALGCFVGEIYVLLWKEWVRNKLKKNRKLMGGGGAKVVIKKNLSVVVARRGRELFLMFCFQKMTDSVLSLSLSFCFFFFLNFLGKFRIGCQN